MDECKFCSWPASTSLLIVPQVHINDLVELYILVLSTAMAGADKSGPYAKFYFGSVQEHVWGDIIRQIGQILDRKSVV